MTLRESNLVLCWSFSVCRKHLFELDINSISNSKTSYCRDVFVLNKIKLKFENKKKKSQVYLEG